MLFALFAVLLKTFPIRLLTGAPREKEVRLGAKMIKSIPPAPSPKSLLLFYSQMLYQASPLASPFNMTIHLGLSNAVSLKEP